MYKDDLTRIGLNNNQAIIYEMLVSSGPMIARKIQRLTRIARQIVYKELDLLENLGLVEKRKEDGKTTVFVAIHPSKIKSFAEQKVEEIKNASQSLDRILGKMISDFNITHSQPGIKIFDGIMGIKELYNDILKEKGEILLMRSSREITSQEILEHIRNQVSKQVQANISVRIISPLMSDTFEKMRLDKERLTTRRIVPKEILDIPAQIIIYADKVAITTYDAPFTTTIIENAIIKTTFASMFEYIWSKSKEEHEKICREREIEIKKK